jgi:D-erythro-7,8-dihydroneopterin triphosphate epimerase
VDRILITELCLPCVIGVNDDERRAKQEVVISIAISADLRKAGKSDRLDDTINYSALKKRIIGIVVRSQFFLIEALAEAIARICLEDPAAAEVTVRVDKPHALHFARTVGVEITRRRGRR